MIDMHPMIKMVVYLLMLLISSCSLAEVESGGTLNFPTTLVSVDGWHGIKLIKSEKYGQPQCKASIPNDFGLKKDEIEFMNYFIAHSRQIQDESNCDILTMKYGVLDQLRLLATQKQETNAASILLFYGTPSMQFNLDGEVAETYFESYLLPVLEKYRKIKGLLIDGKTELLAKDICAEVTWRQDIKDSKMLARISQMVSHLRTVGANQLADKIPQICKLNEPRTN